MRYGAMNFPIKPVCEEIERIAALGFDYLELALDAPMAHFSIVRAQARDIQRMLSRYSLGLVCHMPTFVSTADLTESIRNASRKEVLSSLEAAAELGATKAVLHPSHVGGLGPLVMEQSRRYAMESLIQTVEAARRLGLQICLENMSPKYLSLAEPEEFEEIFAALPDLWLTLDTGHAHIDDPSANRAWRFLARYGERIGHVHVSDNRGRHDEHLPLGAGSVDIVAVVEALHHAGYDDTITLEIFTQAPGDLISSRAFLERLLQKSGRRSKK
jgi:sugar phosphate isomerase/epimerase